MRATSLNRSCAGEGKNYRVPSGYSGMDSSELYLFFLMALSALLIVPCSVVGATPPQSAHMTVSVSNDTLSPGEDLNVSAVWSRDASSYHPPESVDEIVRASCRGKV